MKKLFLLAVCMLSMLTVSAQMKPTMMFEVGIGMSGWTGDAAKGSNALFNPRVGISADIPLNEWFSFQPGLSWVSKGVKSDISSQGVNSDVQINQNYFQVPLMAAFHMRATDNFDLVFTAGPYIAVGVNGKTEVDVVDFYNAIKSSRKIYPDSIIKELDQFRETFKDLCKEENVVLPVVKLEDLDKEQTAI